MQVWLVPGTQLPVPSQRAASVTVDPLHVWPPHAVPGGYSRHAPAPVQDPSVPQLIEPASAHWARGSWPAAAGVQAPRVPVSAHDTQVPVQGWLQHTPCSHAPDWHSPSAAQSMPFGRLPQTPPRQTLPPLQLALLVHDVRHWPFPPQT